MFEFHTFNMDLLTEILYFYEKLIHLDKIKQNQIEIYLISSCLIWLEQKKYCANIQY